MALCLKGAAELPVVVDFTVQHHHDRAVPVLHRLFAARGIDDGQPHAERDRSEIAKPKSSGPRCRIVSHIARGISLSGRRRSVKAAMPAMPHTTAAPRGSGASCFRTGPG